MLYAIVHRGQKNGWALTRNKNSALRHARAWNKTHTHDKLAEVWSHVDVPEVSAWDWPTFVQGARRVYPRGRTA